MVEDMNKYLEKEVIIRSLEARGHLIQIDGAKIEVKTETHGRRLFYTGTGPNDNAIANGYVVFVDPSLKEPFMKDYEEYRHTFMGETDSFTSDLLRYYS